MLTITPAFILLGALALGWKIKDWKVFPMVLSMMFAFALSASSPFRPAIEAFNDALISVMNSVGGGSGLV